MPMFLKNIGKNEEVTMKVNQSVGNFVIPKKTPETEIESANSGRLSNTNGGASKISEPSISTAGGNHGDGGGPSSKLDRLVQLEPEVRLDLVNKFKEFIKSGEYKINPDELSSKMISDALEEDLS